MKLSFSAGLVVAGLLLSACGAAAPAAAHHQRAPRATDAPTTPTAATSTATPTAAATPGPTSPAASLSPSDDPSTPTGPAPVSSSAVPGADAAPTAEKWADDLFAGKSADACSLMNGTATQQLIGYAQKSDPSVRNCGDAALALFQQADMQGTAYAKATAKPAEQDATSITFTLTYTEGHKQEKVTLTQAQAGWLVDDYQPAS